MNDINSTQPVIVQPARPITSSQPAELKEFHCRNRDCHAVLGYTNGYQLLCGENAVFPLKVTITCRRCGQVRMWRPLVPEITPPDSAPPK